MRASRPNIRICRRWGVHAPVCARSSHYGDSMISVDAFESSRRFQIWTYQVGHSQLLLRSVKGDDHSSRIDVRFKAVDLIELPSAFDGLVIRRDGQLYKLSGPMWSGRVVAGSCFQAEDTGEYFDPSPFADSLA
jgi:hypothetical protein